MGNEKKLDQNPELCLEIAAFSDDRDLTKTLILFYLKNVSLTDSSKIKSSAIKQFSQKRKDISLLEDLMDYIKQILDENADIKNLQSSIKSFPVPLKLELLYEFIKIHENIEGLRSEFVENLFNEYADLYHRRIYKILSLIAEKYLYKNRKLSKSCSQKVFEYIKEIPVITSIEEFDIYFLKAANAYIIALMDKKDFEKARKTVDLLYSKYENLSFLISSMFNKEKSEHGEYVKGEELYINSDFSLELEYLLAFDRDLYRFESGIEDKEAYKKIINKLRAKYRSIAKEFSYLLDENFYEHLQYRHY